MQMRIGTTGGFALLDTLDSVSLDACTHCSILHLDTTGTGMAFGTIPLEFEHPVHNASELMLHCPLVVTAIYGFALLTPSAADLANQKTTSS